LIDTRYPVYSNAEITIDVGDETAPETARKIIDALINYNTADN
jgi:hypothetical protein